MTPNSSSASSSLKSDNREFLQPMIIPTVNSHRIAANRQAFSTKDAAVSAANGWQDLCLDHGFYDLGRGPTSASPHPPSPEAPPYR